MEHESVGNLQQIYYDNKDIKLLLDLLAESSGIAISIKILAFFDEDFKKEVEKIV